MKCAVHDRSLCLDCYGEGGRRLLEQSQARIQKLTEQVAHQSLVASGLIKSGTPQGNIFGPRKGGLGSPLTTKKPFQFAFQVPSADSVRTALLRKNWPPQVKASIDGIVAAGKDLGQRLLEGRALLETGDSMEGGRLVREVVADMVRFAVAKSGKFRGPVVGIGGGSFARDELQPYSDCDIGFLVDPTTPTDESDENLHLLEMFIDALGIAASHFAGMGEDSKFFPVDSELKLMTPARMAATLLDRDCLMTMCDVAPLWDEGKLFPKLDKELTQQAKGNMAVLMGAGARKYRDILRDNQISKTTGELSLKDRVYRPLQCYVSVLAVVFQERLSMVKASVDRIFILVREKKAERAFADKLIYAFGWVMKARRELQVRIKNSDNQSKVPATSVDGRVEEAIQLIKAQIQGYLDTGGKTPLLPAPTTRSLFKFFGSKSK